MPTTHQTHTQANAGNWMKLPWELASAMLPRRGSYTEAQAAMSLLMFVHKDRRLPTIYRAARRWGWGQDRTKRFVGTHGPGILSRYRESGEVNGEVNGEVISVAGYSKPYSERGGKRGLLLEDLSEGLSEGGGSVTKNLPRAVTATAPPPPVPAESISTTDTTATTGTIPNDSKLLLDHFNEGVRYLTGMPIPDAHQRGVERTIRKMLTEGATVAEMRATEERYIKSRRERGKPVFYGEGLGTDLREKLAEIRVGQAAGSKDEAGEAHARVGRGGDHWSRAWESTRHDDDGDRHQLRVVHPPPTRTEPSAYREYAGSELDQHPENRATPEEMANLAEYLAARRAGRAEAGPK